MPYRPFDAPFVWTNNHETITRDFQRTEMIIQNAGRVHVIDRNIEKTLDLIGMQVFDLIF